MFHLVIYKKATGEIKRIISRNKTVAISLASLGFSSVLYDQIKVVSNSVFNTSDWFVEKGILKKKSLNVPLISAIEDKQDKTKLIFVGDKPTDNTGFGTQYSLLERGLSLRGYQIQYISYSEIPRLVDMSFDYVITLSDFGSVRAMFDLQLKNWIYWFALESEQWPDEWDDLLKKASYIVPILPFAKHALEKKKLPSQKDIPHGIDFEVFRPIPLRQRAILRRENRVDSNFVVSYLGTNVQRKRLDLLIESYAKFVKSYDTRFNSLLLLKTKGKGYYNLNELVKKAMNVHGLPVFDKQVRVIEAEMDSKQISDFINLSDLGFNATSGEGFCVPIIEYLACGVPFLMGEHTSANDLLSHFPSVKIASKIVDERTRWTRYNIDTGCASELINEYYQKWKNNQAPSKQTLRELVLRFDSQRIVDSWDSFIQQLEQERLDKIYLNKASTLLDIKSEDDARLFEVGKNLVDATNNETDSNEVKWIKVT